MVSVQLVFLSGQYILYISPSISEKDLNSPPLFVMSEIRPETFGSNNAHRGKEKL